MIWWDLESFLPSIIPLCGDCRTILKLWYPSASKRWSTLSSSILSLKEQVEIGDQSIGQLNLVGTGQDIIFIYIIKYNRVVTHADTSIIYHLVSVYVHEKNHNCYSTSWKIWSPHLETHGNPAKSICSCWSTWSQNMLEHLQAPRAKALCWNEGWPCFQGQTHQGV